ncbi:hypothetical protein ATANTOWER_028296 [Ataeniobius toweri]|uniref:Uncharacterized protein n=1 Tax=Ataeniobius toweri TaxID=208326 RepID=A0ABU7C0V1_9TELE|nr:hypothetical protein [Ataeniobius toweri]
MRTINSGCRLQFALPSPHFRGMIQPQTSSSFLIFPVGDTANKVDPQRKESKRFLPQIFPGLKERCLQDAGNFRPMGSKQESENIQLQNADIRLCCAPSSEAISLQCSQGRFFLSI